MRKTLFFLVFLLLAANALAATSVFSSWVKANDEFSADGYNYTVLDIAVEIDQVLVRSELGVASAQYGAYCNVQGKYEYCLTDYRFKTFGNKTRLNDKDPEEYLLEIKKLYGEAEVTHTRTANTTLFIGDKTLVETKITNGGDSTATNLYYEEAFPAAATVSTTSLQKSGSKVYWSGAIASGIRKDFSYEITFQQNGTFNIPILIKYFNGVKNVEVKQDLVFTIKKEYDVSLVANRTLEPFQPATLTVTLTGTPIRDLALTLDLPTGIEVLNTTFEKETTDIFWEGTYTDSKTFTTDFLTEQDLPNKDIALKVCYKNTYVCTTHTINLTSAHKKPRFDYVVFKDGKNKFKLFLKNENAYAKMTNIEMTLSSDVYAKSMKLDELAPKKSVMLLDDVIDANDLYLNKFNLRTTYYIGTTQYDDVMIGNFTENKEILATSRGETTPVPSVVVSDVKVNGSKNASAQASPGPTPVAPPPTQEQAPPTAPSQDAQAPKEQKGIIQRFFEWLGSIFG